jgi:hypothetical protein
LVSRESRELLLGQYRRDAELQMQVLRLCRSPAEQLLAAAISAEVRAAPNPVSNRFQWSFSGMPPADILTACCCPQHAARVGGASPQVISLGLYLYVTRPGRRADKLVWPEFGRLVVEVHSNDFHERTAEELAAGEARDRLLAEHGYTVTRLLGTEVLRNPARQAEAVLNQLERLASTFAYGVWRAGEMGAFAVGEYDEVSLLKDDWLEEQSKARRVQQAG